MLHLCLYKDQSILDIRRFRGIYSSLSLSLSLSLCYLGDRYEHSGGRLFLHLQATAMSVAMSITRQIICSSFNLHWLAIFKTLFALLDEIK